MTLTTADDGQAAVGDDSFDTVDGHGCAPEGRVTLAWLGAAKPASGFLPQDASALDSLEPMSGQRVVPGGSDIGPETTAGWTTV
jgi:hypothetical protein